MLQRQLYAAAAHTTLSSPSASKEGRRFSHCSANLCIKFAVILRVGLEG